MAGRDVCHQSTRCRSSVVQVCCCACWPDNFCQIHSIRERGRIPILVGGTHYYTQSLLFHDALAEAGDETHDGSQWPILDATPEEMLEKLQEVDPIMAERWHPNDGRKIRRSLEIYFKTGKRASELYAQQEDRRSNGHLKSVGDLEVDVEEAAGSPEAGLRFPTLFLWTHTPRDVLKERLRGRVDNMVEEGLIREAQDLEASAEKYEAAGKAVDRGRGVYISIGYKELIAYLTAFRNDDSDQTNLEGLRAEAIEDIKSATWRYAKTQERWIRRRLFNALQQDRKAGSLFVLDTADPLRWEANVCNPAAEITRMFLQGETLPENRTMSSHAEEILQPLIGDAAVPTSSARRTRTCDICNVITTTEQEFLLHVNSNRHHKCVRALQKRRLGITPHVGPEDG